MLCRPIHWVHPGLIFSRFQHRATIRSPEFSKTFDNLAQRTRPQSLAYITSKHKNIKTPRHVNTGAKQSRAAKDSLRHIPQFDALEALLASRGEPTILYQARSSRCYLWIAYSIGTFCLAYGVFHIYELATYRYEGLWWPVPVAMNIVSIFMLGIGLASFVRSRRLIRRISAVPVTTKSSEGRRIIIQIEPQKVLSFTSQDKITKCSPDNIVLQRRVRTAIEKRITSNVIERQPVVLSLFSEIFCSIRALASGDGIIKLKVDGEIWRMDIGTGNVLDSGQIFDRLFRCDE